MFTYICAHTSSYSHSPTLTSTHSHTASNTHTGTLRYPHTLLIQSHSHIFSHAHTHANIYFHTYSGTHTHIWSHNVYMCSAYACINSQIFSPTHTDTLTYIHFPKHTCSLSLSVSVSVSLTLSPLPLHSLLTLSSLACPVPFFWAPLAPHYQGCLHEDGLYALLIFFPQAFAD